MGEQLEELYVAIRPHHFGSGRTPDEAIAYCAMAGSLNAEHANEDGVIEAKMYHLDGGSEYTIGSFGGLSSPHDIEELDDVEVARFKHIEDIEPGDNISTMVVTGYVEDIEVPDDRMESPSVTYVDTYGEKHTDTVFRGNDVAVVNADIAGHHADEDEEGVDGSE